MEILTLEEIVEAVSGEIIYLGNNKFFKNVTTDSRKIKKGDIFIALHGEIFDGNEFVEEAALKGADLCIVDSIKYNKENISKYTSIIKVEYTNKALMDLAKYYRSKLDIKVIGITGSTGKTSTKDFVAAALSSKLNVFKTEGNFNNEIGLPIMIFKLNNLYDVAVLEMGMSNFGEIHNLADIARPDIAVITNIGISHIENLKTRENILKSKLEITDFFNNNSILIINNDNDMLNAYDNKNINIIRIGTSGNVNFKAFDIKLHENSIEYTIKEINTDKEHNLLIKALGEHNVLNSLLAVACSRVLSIDYEYIQKGINCFEASPMRLDIIRSEKFVIVNDCYNASPDSMIAALNVLSTINGRRKIAVLGTMMELGDKAYYAHYEVGKYASVKGVDLLLTVGEYNEAYKEGYSNLGDFKGFESKQKLIDYLEKEVIEGDVILIKASRAMRFEDIVSELVLLKQNIGTSGGASTPPEAKASISHV